MSRNKIIKKQALGQLSGKFFSAIASIVLVILGIMSSFLILNILNSLREINVINSNNEIYVFSLTFLVIGIIFLAVSLLYLGVIKWFYELSCGEDPALYEIFYYFKTVKLAVNAIIFNLYMLLIYVGTGAFCLMPGVVCGFGAHIFSQQKNNAAMAIMIFLASVLTIFGLIAYISIILRYFLSIYLFVSNKETKPLSCLKRSYLYMKGFKVTVFNLNLSFLWWVLPCILILPIIYFIPYYITSNANCAKWVIKTSEEESGL